ncbi:MAG: sensor histidine kinase [Campylobacteraceae bacterium]|nr:sensor histidine kinase [Campylobacteraceae bacterium]
MRVKFRNLLSKFYQFENAKIYAILFLFTIMVTSSFILSYFQIKNEILNLGSSFRNSISKEISFSTNEWLSTRIKSIENFASFLEFFTNSYSEEESFEFVKESNIIDKDSPFFDHYQIIFENGFLIFDNKFEKIENLESVMKTCWFQKSICGNNSSSISIVNHHDILNTRTIHICSTFENSVTEGSVCGVIIASEFFQKIRPKIHPFVDNAYLFDEDGEIISSLIKKENYPNLKQSFLNSKEESKGWIFKYQDNFIEVVKIPLVNWYVGVSIDEKVITDSTIQILVKNGTVLTILFLLLIIFSNYIHTFIHNKILKKQKEYEFILSHQLKMSETGELIASIAHQLKQPLNSSLLLLSSTKDQKNSGDLSDEELLENLDLCIKSTLLMNETVESFRNFYEFKDDISEFDLYTAIVNLTKLLQMDFAKYSISLFIDKFNIKVVSNESFLQQILLVLLQNSKDALRNKERKKRIYIEARVEGEFVEIYVKDTGHGVSNPSTLFTKYKKSTKKHGSGIGLYLSKVIAQDKLGGDIELFQAKNPTIFKLTIKQNMEQK